MHRPLKALAALTLMAGLAAPSAGFAQGPAHTKVGSLTCDISGGIGAIIASKKHVTCMFTPSQPGPREVYTGAIEKFCDEAIAANPRSPLTAVEHAWPSVIVPPERAPLGHV